MLAKNDLLYLAKNQKKLDNHILEKFELLEDQTLTKRILAFLIELAEFINEQRDFKYWSVKPASERDVLLEEYIDGIHFIISIGNTLQVNYENYQYVNKYYDQEVSLTTLYLNCFYMTTKFSKKQTVKNYFKMLSSYFFIADCLKLSAEELIMAYNKKNAINFNRQDNNY